MYAANATVLSQMQLQVEVRGSQQGDGAVRTALSRFGEVWFAARLGQLWLAVVGGSRRLLRLADVRRTCSLAGSHYAGTRSVPIDRIKGSEGRSEDFDANWRPLRLHSKGRWVSLASARQQGVALPPVDLIQVGGVYFVRDGHHRISVARAFGQECVDAEVTVWQVA